MEHARIARKAAYWQLKYDEWKKYGLFALLFLFLTLLQMTYYKVIWIRVGVKLPKYIKIKLIKKFWFS